MGNGNKNQTYFHTIREKFKIRINKKNNETLALKCVQSTSDVSILKLSSWDVPQASKPHKDKTLNLFHTCQIV